VYVRLTKENSLEDTNHNLLQANRRSAKELFVRLKEEQPLFVTREKTFGLGSMLSPTAINLSLETDVLQFRKHCAAVR
jgi:hypothetical protein